MGKKGQLIIFSFLQDGVNKLSLLLSSITTIQQSKLFLIKISSLGFDLLYKPFNPVSADLLSNIVCEKIEELVVLLVKMMRSGYVTDYITWLVSI